ncbi:RNA degradosome polyphosphate kinase [Helicobacter sp. MIT 14-3879]|uniref:RNA degradosome polyphosphate kinase n=1 Tax=Helicobacter sp. MIT 14-3879 TaxID=2040649 RepID=UPI000E1F8982|nr:RNA degradosome polyphosphate kinase [Helicobacter sp. MIT 14-3879]RDU65530.1 RNA degradosome polyphosphate kinase [Helicobacter sp. MIT 14-3879]
MKQDKVEKLFFNRELSWLRFNTRVLNEASNEKIPLLERLKFIAIYGTNLDEFYMVRVAGLKRLYLAGITDCGADKLTPREQLAEIRKYIHKEKKFLEQLFEEILNKAQKEYLFIKKFNDLNNEQKKYLREFFLNNLYPIIVPIMVDSTHPFPHLNNLSFGMAIKLKDTLNKNKIKFGMVRISRMLPRFIEVNEEIYIPIEMVVGEFIDYVFEGCEVLSYTSFRVTRNADMEIEEEEADDFIEIMAEGLKARKKGEVVRLEVGNTNDESLIEFITGHIKIDEEDIYRYSIPLNLSALWQIIGSNRFAHLRLPSFNSRILPPLSSVIDIFKSIDSSDIALFHPYESFDPVVNFIQSAANDPDVYSIRMTLYRVGKNSPIVKALTYAAENNKQVTVLVELKARFDEENNLYWAKALETAGAHVIYGIPGLKVHAKIALVIKKIGNSFRKYVHLSTGNYNPVTAKIYTDISYFTSNENIANDAIRLFHTLSTGYANKAKLDSLFVAPTQIKPKLLELIKEESKKGSDGYIILKANAVVDVDIIEALYDASKAGVKIDMIVRGICCLIPKLSNISENIRVISIVGKYLEHARIYYFKNSNPQIYFASADLMPRNLEKRVEIMTPVTNKNIADKLFGILKLQIEDNTQSHELQSNGEYIKLTPKDTNAINSQEEYEKYVNLMYSALLKTQDSKDKKLVKRMMGEN